MFALHWIWTLAMVSCLIAQPVRRDAGELLDHISELNTTIRNLNCPDDIRLYSPTLIKEDCMSSALNCTIDELLVLNDECNIPEEDFDVIQNVVVGLRGKQIIPTSSSPNCSCEMYEQTDVETFLKNIEDQVQRLNSSK